MRPEATRRFKNEGGNRPSSGKKLKKNSQFRLLEVLKNQVDDVVTDSCGANLYKGFLRLVATLGGVVLSFGDGVDVVAGANKVDEKKGQPDCGTCQAKGKKKLVACLAARRCAGSGASLARNYLWVSFFLCRRASRGENTKSRGKATHSGGERERDI